MNKKIYTALQKLLSPLLLVMIIFSCTTTSALADLKGLCQLSGKIKQEDKWMCRISEGSAGCLLNHDGNTEKCFTLKGGEEQGKNLVRFFLIPLQFLITYAAYIMGFFFLAWGLYRLRHSHEGGGAMRQASGTGSFLCFLAAALLFQYQYAAKLVGNSILGANLSGTTQWDYSSGTITAGTDPKNRRSLPIDPTNIFGYYNAPNNEQDQLAYGTDLNGQGNVNLKATAYGWSDSEQDQFSTLQTLFATLMIVGFISFVRGAMLLVKAGEGVNSGESTGTKAVTHLIAGGILCNANHAAAIINNVIQNVNSSGQS